MCGTDHAPPLGKAVRADENTTTDFWTALYAGGSSMLLVVSSDYSAKIWLVMDSIRYHRSDTAIVRVVVPVLNGNDAQASETGLDFVKAMFPMLEVYLPS